MAETTIMQEKVFVNPDHSIQVLYQLSELWRDKKLCDATIEVGPVKVYVHRLVLLAACPYLLSIGGCQDVSILEVKLPLSVGLEGLNVFLTYLYDGVLNLSTNNLLSVEKISNIMKVVGIRKFCEEFREMDQSVRNSVGPPEVVSSEHSVRVKENSVQIIFGESSSDLKQDIVQENESESDCKRRKMNVESLSPILQQSSTVARKKETPKRKIKLKISKSPKGIRSSCTEVKQQESDELSNVSIKQEPDNYSDDGDNESFDDAVQTDFVRQAPYNTQALASSDEEDETSHTSGVQEQGHSHVDASRVLQNVVKNMPEVALGLDTAAEIDDDNQPRKMVSLLGKKPLDVTTHRKSLKKPKSHAKKSIIIETAPGEEGTVVYVRNKTNRSHHQCPNCKYVSNFKSNLNKHIKCWHSGLPSHKKPEFMCDQCSKCFRSRYGLNLHVKSVHEKSFQFQCEYCAQQFNQTTQFLNHVSRHRNVEECVHCRKKFNNKESLSCHLETCTVLLSLREVDAKYTCSVCHKNFCSQNSLNEHVKGKHGPRTYKCTACERIFAWRSSLQAHRKRCLLKITVGEEISAD